MSFNNLGDDQIFRGTSGSLSTQKGEKIIIPHDDIDINKLKLISDSKDLPFDSNSNEHILKDDTVYKFDGFITSPYPIRLGNSTPLIGNHGATDGFIHTGMSTAIKGNGSGFFARDMYLHAPGGTVFDLTGTTSEEMLVESISISDAAGLGNIANLGTIDGFRVPSIKGCNFGNFDAGLLFTGTSEKIFISSSPFRGVTESGVTILDFDAGCTVGIVDLPNNYVKSVQSDTEVVRVDPSATVDDVFQYRGNTHDSSVTISNILTGAAGTEQIGYLVEGSFRLSDSTVAANYSLNSSSTTTITEQASSKTDESAYVKITGPTTTVIDERFTTGDNSVTYEGKKDTEMQLTANLAIGGDAAGNGDIVSAAWFKNGSIVAGTPTRVDTPGRGNQVAVALTVVGIDPDASTDDSYEVRIANLDSVSNIDVGEFDGLLQGDV